jgi:tRNA pseudouridine55 synthase
MTRAKNKVDGIVLLDKPTNITSNKLLQKVKFIFNAKKAGHTGSLDPIATGALPICFGEATKVSKYLIESSKTYHVFAKLGEKTNTGDSDGIITEKKTFTQINTERCESILKSFIGETEQMPPMFSAIKVDGVRLYKQARKGLIIPRKKRTINIHNIYLKNLSFNSMELIVHCGKGTYIRSLIEDIAAKLETFAHVIKLRRTSIDVIEDHELITIESLESEHNYNRLIKKYLLPIDVAIESFPKLSTTLIESIKFRQGQRIKFSLKRHFKSVNVRVYDLNDSLIGLGVIDNDGIIQPTRIFNLIN